MGKVTVLQKAEVLIAPVKTGFIMVSIRRDYFGKGYAANDGGILCLWMAVRMQHNAGQGRIILIRGTKGCAAKLRMSRIADF